MPLATPTVLFGFLLPWAWGISSRLLQQSAATAPYLGRGYLLTTAPPALEHGVAPFSPPAILGDWNAKVGNQETPGVTGKFGLGVQNEARPRLIQFCQKNALVTANTSSDNTRGLCIWTSPDDQY